MTRQRGFFYQVAVATTALTLSFAAIAIGSEVIFRTGIPAGPNPFAGAVAQSVTFLKDLADVSDSLSPSNGQVLTFSGGQWTSATPGSIVENDTLADVTGRGATTTSIITATGFVGAGTGLTSLPSEILSLNGLAGVTLTSPSNGQILSFDGTNWVNSIPATITETDPNLPAAGTAGNILTSNGSVWTSAAFPSIDALSDVTATGLTSGDNGKVLTYNSSTGWTAQSIATASEADTLETVTGRGASTSANLTLNGTLTLGGAVTATGQTITAGTFSGAHSGSGTGLTSLPSLGLHSDVTLTTPHRQPDFIL